MTFVKRARPATAALAILSLIATPSTPLFAGGQATAPPKSAPAAAPATTAKAAPTTPPVDGGWPRL
ncbi:MAG TPA: hypothetical protein VF147_00300, partial [Vicinamibacterales bacterium]